MFNRDKQFIIGVGQRSPITLTWDLLNGGMLIAGKPGMGKTNTLNLIISQLALLGARLVVADYNGYLPQALSSNIEHLEKSLLIPIAKDARETITAIQLVNEIGQKRLKKEMPCDYPIVLVIDEFTSFVRQNPLPKVENISRKKSGNTEQKATTVQPTYLTILSDILNTMRKADIVIIVSGQNFVQIGNESGLRVFRSTFTHTLLHGLSPADARLMSDSVKIANRVEVISNKNLRGVAVYNGEYVKIEKFSTTLQNKIKTRLDTTPSLPDEHTKQILTIQSYITAHIDTLLPINTPSSILPTNTNTTTSILPNNQITQEQTSTSTSTTTHTQKSLYNGLEKGHIEEAEAEATDDITPHYQKIVEMIKSGSTNTDIVKEVFNIKGGRRFSKLSSEITKIRQIIKLL